MDRHTKLQRSKNMAAIRSKGNKSTENAFAKLLRTKKISGWRRHVKGAFGSPDFTFPKSKVVLFVDGCFWHGCPKHCIMPKSNEKYWVPKIARNKKRDRIVNTYYREKGWKVFRVWEHQLKKNPERVLVRLSSVFNLQTKRQET